MPFARHVLLRCLDIASRGAAIEALKVPENDQMEVLDESLRVDYQMVYIGYRETMRLEHMLEVFIEVYAPAFAEEALRRLKWDIWLARDYAVFVNR